MNLLNKSIQPIQHHNALICIAIALLCHGCADTEITSQPSRMISADQSTAKLVADVVPDQTNLVPGIESPQISTNSKKSNPSSGTNPSQQSGDQPNKLVQEKVKPPTEISQDTKLKTETKSATKQDQRTPASKVGPPVTVKKEPILTRNGKTYNPNQLHKNQTLLVLAAQSDIRARLVLAPFRTVISNDQYDAAMEIALAQDQQFEELLRERASVLETAFDGQDVEAKLIDIKMRTSDLLIGTRSKIQRTVLSKEQQKAAIKLWNEWIDLEKSAKEAIEANKAPKFEKPTQDDTAPQIK